MISEMATAVEDDGVRAGEEEKKEMISKVPPSEEQKTEETPSEEDKAAEKPTTTTVVESKESKDSPGSAVDGSNDYNAEQFKKNVKELLSSSRIFEASRRKYCDREAQSSIAYWESLKVLVNRNLLNIEKSSIYIKSRLKVERVYAESLYNLEDMIEGNTEGNKQNLPKGLRRHQDSSSRLIKKGTRSKATGIAYELDKNATALEHMYWHDANAANLIVNMCDDVEEKAVNVLLEKTRIDITKSYSQIIAQGDACFEVLKAHEISTQEAFRNLERTISATLAELDASKDGSAVQLKSPKMAPNGTPIHNDVWRADCRYKIRASQHLMIQEDAQTELSKRFSGIKTLEGIRRAAIQESLIYLVRAYDSLLRDLPLLRDPVLLMLDRIVTDKASLEHYVHAALGQGVREQVAEGGAVPESGEKLSSSDETTSEVPFNDLSKKLQSPLSSSLVAKLALVQRRKDSVMIARWTQCLLVATKQNYLYAYDVKRQCKTPEEAFNHMLPVTDLKSVLKSAEKTTNRSFQTTIRNCEENVTLDLAHCYCEIPAVESGKGGHSQLTIVEVKKATGIVTMLRTFNQNHLVLRDEKQDMQNLAKFVTPIGAAGVREAIAQGFLP